MVTWMYCVMSEMSAVLSKSGSVTHTVVLQWIYRCWLQIGYVDEEGQILLDVHDSVGE